MHTFLTHALTWSSRTDASTSHTTYGIHLLIGPIKQVLALLVALPSHARPWPEMLPNKSLTPDLCISELVSCECLRSSSAHAYVSCILYKHVPCLWVHVHRQVAVNGLYAHCCRGLTNARPHFRPIHILNDQFTNSSLVPCFQSARNEAVAKAQRIYFCGPK